MMTLHKRFSRNHSYRGRGASKTLQWALLVCLVAGTVFSLTVAERPAIAKAINEYKLKAVFLYRLSLFVTWPPEAFSDATAPLVIGILGDDPFGNHLDLVAAGEKVDGRTIRIRRYKSERELIDAPCQILYINRSFSEQWSQLKPFLGRFSLLTVSDMPGFGQKGGMVSIRKYHNRIKIGVNLAESRKSGLVISAKLLKVAQQVRTDAAGEGQ